MGATRVAPGRSVSADSASGAPSSVSGRGNDPRPRVVPVRVADRTVPVEVFVDQIRPNEQVVSARIAAGSHPPLLSLLIQNHGPIGDQGHYVQFMSCDDERPARRPRRWIRSTRTTWSAGQVRLWARPRGEPPDGAKGRRRSLRASSRRRELEGRPVRQVGDLHRRQGLVAALAYLLRGQAQLKRPNATSSRTVALKSWMSGSWKTSPTWRWK